MPICLRLMWRSYWASKESSSPEHLLESMQHVQCFTLVLSRASCRHSWGDMLESLDSPAFSVKDCITKSVLQGAQKAFRHARVDLAHSRIFCNEWHLSYIAKAEGRWSLSGAGCSAEHLVASQLRAWRRTMLPLTSIRLQPASCTLGSDGTLPQERRALTFAGCSSADPFS